MSVAEVKLQNLELAWRRIKLDISHRVFIRNPFEVQIIEQDLKGYLNNILDSIESNTFYPKPMLVCNAPKGYGLLRPGAHLAIEDRIFYYWCLGMCLPNIYETLRWSQGIDFSYQISGDFENAEWLKDRFIGWRDFRIKSLEKVTDDISHVVIADLAAYYENIDILLLLSDLRATGASSEIVDSLSKCLNRWAQVTGRGIPQGYSPSDFLGKLYLNSVDLNLKAMGFEHLRYVDDIRIFCHNESEAKKALITLADLLRKRGLNFQSAKTRIYVAADARQIIDGVQPKLQPILQKYTRNIIEILGIENSSLSVAQADELLKNMQDNTSIEVVIEAFREFFLENDDEEYFNKTLFRFLVNRLGNAQEDFALDYCLKMLKEHPEETETILKYIKSIDAMKKTESIILKFINSNDAVYSYQLYQILEWFSEYVQGPSEELVSFCREMAFDKSQPRYLKTISRKIIGEFGTNADWERLEQLYAELDSEKEKSEVICCLKNMEKTKRNSFFSRAKHDGDLIKRATELVKKDKKGT
jgi:hypothetical protein